MNLQFAPPGKVVLKDEHRCEALFGVHFHDSTQSLMTKQPEIFDFKVRFIACDQCL